MKEKCIVHGCKNHKGEGGFVGDLCSPCHHMLTTGELNESEAWFAKQLLVTRKILSSIAPDQIPGAFICGYGGEVGEDGLHSYYSICPAYGVDWSVTYKRAQ